MSEQISGRPSWTPQSAELFLWINLSRALGKRDDASDAFGTRIAELAARAELEYRNRGSLDHIRNKLREQLAAAIAIAGRSGTPDTAEFVLWGIFNDVVWLARAILESRLRLFAPTPMALARRLQCTYLEARDRLASLEAFCSRQRTEQMLVRAGELAELVQQLVDEADDAAAGDRLGEIRSALLERLASALNAGDDPLFWSMPASSFH